MISSTERKIFDDYFNGMNRKDIAVKYNIPYKRISYILKKVRLERKRRM